MVYCPGNNCSGHGDCVTISTTPTCNCEFGWIGADCSTPLPHNDEVLQTAAVSSSQYNAFYSNQTVMIAILTTVGFVALMGIGFIVVEVWRRRMRNSENRILRRASQLWKTGSTEPTISDFGLSLSKTRSVSGHTSTDILEI